MKFLIKCYTAGKNWMILWIFTPGSYVQPHLPVVLKSYAIKGEHNAFNGTRIQTLGFHYTAAENPDRQTHITLWGLEI